MDSKRQNQCLEDVDMITNGDCNKENGSGTHFSQMKYYSSKINASHDPNSALESYGIVSLKESKIDSWTNKNGGNGVVRNNGGTLNDRLKLTLPLDSNNRTGISIRQQEQPRMAWAEQHLSDE
jgi:hypothetical protein